MVSITYSRQLAGIKKMSRLVSLVKQDDTYTSIYKSLDLIKDELTHRINHRKHILIKPNMTATKNIYSNTNVGAIEAVLTFFKNKFKNFDKLEFTIEDGSGSAFYENTTTKSVFERFGYYELENEFKNVKILTLDDCRDFFEVPIKTAKGDGFVRVARHINDYDYKISVTPIKTHNYAIATLGIKNMLGYIKQEDKSLVHGLKLKGAPGKTIFDYIPTSIISKARRIMPSLVNIAFRMSPTYRQGVKLIHHNIASVAKEIYPDLVVLDCYYGMEGDGPIDGTRIYLGAAIASTDALKADGIGARLMGLNPEDIGYLKLLYDLGHGDYSLKGLVGRKISDVKQMFKLHTNYDLQKAWNKK